MPSTLATRVHYAPSNDTSYSAPRPRLLVFLGICRYSTLLLLLIFGDRPGWYSTTLIFFLPPFLSALSFWLRHLATQTLLQMNETLPRLKGIKWSA